MCSTSEVIDNKPPVFPNELFFEVASHIKSFKDLNSLASTSRRFHSMFNTDLYRRAVAADDIVRHNIVVWVLSNYRLPSLTLLLDHGLSLNHAGKFGRYQGTMLFTVCALDDQERSLPLARLLIQRGADVKAKFYLASQTLLHMAGLCNNCGFAQLLLGHHDKPDVNAADRYGDTPLHFASQSGYEMAELLIAHGAAIDAQDDAGSTPLLAAIAEINYVSVPVLLAHGANVRLHDRNGTTPLHLVSRWSPRVPLEVAKSLLEHGADVNAIDGCGRTPLHLTSELPMVKFLLENGGDPNARMNGGTCLLQRALERRRGPMAHIVALLLAHGADASVLNIEESIELYRMKEIIADL